MKTNTVLLISMLAGFGLASCGSQREAAPSMKIESPVDGAALTEGTHDVSLLATHDGEIGQLGLSFERPGFAYVKYALPPGEAIDGETYLANFEWVSDGVARAVIPFPFQQANYSGPYTLRACSFGPQPQSEVLVCTEIDLYMPACGPDEVSLGNDCIPAAVDATATMVAVADELVAIPDRNLNCRLGPGASQFEIDDTLLEGVEYSPVGRGSDGLWLMFVGPVSGNHCWAVAEYLDLNCNGEPLDASGVGCDLVIQPYPPTPTPSSTPLDILYATATELPPQCVDGIDNDGDGRTDYQPPGGVVRGDSQCTSQTDNDEAN